MEEGDRLKYARTFLDVSQGEFCEKIGMKHQSYLSDIENGRRTLTENTANSIQEAYNISAVWLLEGIGEMMLTKEAQAKITAKQSSASAGERLKTWRTRNNYSQKDIAEKIGYKQVAISASESRGSVSRKLANKLEQTFGLSRLWLLEGIGTPEGSKATTPVVPIAPKLQEPNTDYGNVVKEILSVTVDSEGNENMVFVDAKARAGYVEGFADPNYIHELPACRIPGYENGTFRVFEVEGLSMYDTLSPGDQCICRYVDGFNQIRNDRVHVVVTTEGVLVKRVLNRISQSGKIILTSDNKSSGEYPPLVLKPSDIKELWYVQGRITRQLPPPSELYERVTALEGDVIELQLRLKKHE